VSTTPTIVDLHWDGDLRFKVAFSSSISSVPEAPATPGLVLDSAGQAGPSPLAALAAALAGCMGMDLVHILKRGRHPVEDVEAHLEGDRAADEPRRFLRMRLHFTVAGSVPDETVARAVALSREKYCSVWHSLRQDIELQVTFARRA
jgi:putative redox protein